MGLETMPPSQSSLPPSEDHLRLMIANGLGDEAQQLIDHYGLKLRVEAGELKDSLQGSELWLKRFITTDLETLKMLEDVIKLAKCPDEILITGETGTGKELIARAMIGDRQNDNKRAYFIAVNCAGFPEQLIESELFGYVKGAFTGADNTKAGLMAAAKDGVLFLDEIGELPLSVQAKLLRALQDKVIRRVGSNTEEEISCKFVCATHRNIRQMVREERFRQDLYARISTFELHLKPLADRKCDIVPIIESLPKGKEFLLELRRLGKSPIHDLNLDLNIRSLQQYVKRFAVLSRIIL